MPANPAAIRQNLHQLETELEAQERLAQLRERHGISPPQPQPLTPEQMRQMWDESEIVGYGKSGLVARRLVRPGGTAYVLLEYGA